MPATLLIQLLAQYAPPFVEHLVAIWHNGGDLTKEEINALLGRAAKEGKSYFEGPTQP